MEKTDTVVVADAGPLIHLDELQCLDLLDDFKEIMLSDTVLMEVVFHRPCFLASGLIFTTCPVISEIDNALQALFSLFSLHQGEQQSILLAWRRPDVLFLTDDASARLAASQLGINVHGTIGILLRAVRRRQKTKDQAARIISSIPQHSSLHLKQSLIDEVIASLGGTETAG